MIWILGALGWLVISVLAALIIGRAIRIADQAATNDTTDNRGDRP